MWRKRKRLKTYDVQTQRMSLQHGLLPAGRLLVVHVAPGLPALCVSQPPAAQVCGRLRLKRPASPPQLPATETTKLQVRFYLRK